MKNLQIEYSIISPGTERAGQSKGYMAITEPYNGSRYMLALEHSVSTSEKMEKALKCYDYTIENIAISRFELISSLNIKRLKFSENAKILLCGFGPVGFGAMLALKKKNCKNVSILSTKNNVCEIIKALKADFKVVKNAEFEEYDVVIDATGDGNFLRRIIKKAKLFTKIVILGTPRKNNLINALEIHRKNISVFGAHEINGFSQNIRNKVFHRLLQENVDIAQKLCYFIEYNPFDLSLRDKLTEPNRDVFCINILTRKG